MFLGSFSIGCYVFHKIPCQNIGLFAAVGIFHSRTRPQHESLISTLSLECYKLCKLPRLLIKFYLVVRVLYVDLSEYLTSVHFLQYVVHCRYGGAVSPPNSIIHVLDREVCSIQRIQYRSEIGKIVNFKMISAVSMCTEQCRYYNEAHRGCCLDVFFF